MGYRRYRYKRSRTPNFLEIVTEIIIDVYLNVSYLIGEIIYRVLKYIFKNLEKVREVFKLNLVFSKNHNLKSQQITEAEKNFLYALKRIMGDKYTVATKVPISSLIKADHFNYDYFNKIESKTLDFVLFDKEYKPHLAIELDNRSSFRWGRKKKDEFTHDLYKSIGLRMISVRNSHKYDLGSLKNQIFRSQRK